MGSHRFLHSDGHRSDVAEFDHAHAARGDGEGRDQPHESERGQHGDPPELDLCDTDVAQRDEQHHEQRTVADERRQCQPQPAGAQEIDGVAPEPGRGVAHRRDRLLAEETSQPGQCSSEAVTDAASHRLAPQDQGEERNGPNQRQHTDAGGGHEPG